MNLSEALYEHLNVFYSMQTARKAMRFNAVGSKRTLSENPVQPQVRKKCDSGTTVI